MAKTVEILNNEKHIVRTKVSLEQSANINDLCISMSSMIWGKLGWKEGTMLEVRQDNVDRDELTIRLAPRGIKDQLGIKRE